MVAVCVMLNSNREAFLPIRGYQPGDRLREVAKIEVDAASPLAALEVVWGICNSYYPDELNCSPEHAETVKDYRAGLNRSLSVGDVCEIDGVRFACAAFGWDELPNV